MLRDSATAVILLRARGSIRALCRSKRRSRGETLRTGGKGHVQRNGTVTQKAELATETGGVLITNLDNKTRRLSSSRLLTEAVLLLQGVTINAPEARALT
jgi:hypothetical protein